MSLKFDILFVNVEAPIVGKNLGIEAAVVVGNRYGQLVVIGPPGRKVVGPRTRLFVPCRCDCGTVKDVMAGNLAKGLSRSCGCRQLTSRLVHGWSGTRLFKLWRGMLARCHPSYGSATYVRRGIRVCDEWREDFIPFRNWSLSHGYDDGMTIDRIDGHGHYEPANCRWVPPEVNWGRSILTRAIEAFGETKSVIAWTRDPRCRVTPTGLYKRLREGWAAEDAISTSPYARRQLGRYANLLGSGGGQELPR